MLIRTFAVLVVLGVLCPAVKAKDEPPSALEAKSSERVIAHVLPDQRDLTWTKIPWRPTLWEAVVDAHKAKKPILLWAMNGHALACT